MNRSICCIIAFFLHGFLKNLFCGQNLSPHHPLTLVGHFHSIPSTNNIPNGNGFRVEGPEKLDESNFFRWVNQNCPVKKIMPNILNLLSCRSITENYHAILRRSDMPFHAPFLRAKKSEPRYG
jgi:hypothetical protein